MQIKKHIRIFVIRVYALLCFWNKKRSKVIFYHDIHSKKKYTSMSTSIRLFKKHIDIILENGYKIVPEINQKYGQFRRTSVIHECSATFKRPVNTNLIQVASNVCEKIELGCGIRTAPAKRSRVLL